MMTDHTLRRTDELLSELVELVETARTLPMSASCLLPREHTLDLLDELRDALPPEMVEAREVIARRDEVLQLAGDEADRTRQRATEQADAILADATHRAEAVIADVERRAEQVTTAAQREHAELVSNTSVHQAAAAAAAAIRESAEQYHAARQA
jgi:cell division septum initiation protein DivIVA